MADLPIISKKIYKRYFGKGNMNNPLSTVKVSRPTFVKKYKTFLKHTLEMYTIHNIYL